MLLVFVFMISFFFLSFLLLDLFILPCFIVYLFFSILIKGNPVEYAFTLYLYMCLALIPCIIIFYIGLGGIAEPLKELIWAEGYLGSSTFFKGIKRNSVY